MTDNVLILKLIGHLRAIHDLVTDLDLVQSSSPLNLIRQDYCDTINTIIGLLRQNGMPESDLDELRDDLEYNQAAKQFNHYITQRYQERQAA